MVKLCEKQIVVAQARPLLIEKHSGAGLRCWAKRYAPLGDSYETAFNIVIFGAVIGR
jgi:hypothetical protein